MSGLLLAAWAASARAAGPAPSPPSPSSADGGLVVRSVPEGAISVRTSSLALAVDGEDAVALGLESSAPVPLEVRLVSVRAQDGSVAFALSEPRALVLPPAGAGVVRLRAQNVSKSPWTPGTAPRPLELDLTLTVASVPEVAGTEGGPDAGGSSDDAHGPREQRLTHTVDLTLVPAAGPNLVFTGPRRVDVPAGREVEVPIVLESRVGWATLEARCVVEGGVPQAITIPPKGEGVLRVSQKNEASAERLGPADRKSREVELRGSCALTAVTADGARLDRGVEPFVVGFVMFWKVGTSPIAVLVVALFVLFARFLWDREIRPRFTAPSLLGRLVVYAGPGAFRKVTVPLRGRTRLVLETETSGEGAAVRVDGDRVVFAANEAAVAELYAEKSGKRNVMHLRSLQGTGVQLAGVQLGSSPLVVRRGRAKFSIGPYQCRIA